MDKLPPGLVNRKDVDPSIPIQDPHFSFLVEYESLAGKITGVKVDLGANFHKLSPKEQREQLREDLQMVVDDEDFLSMDFAEKLSKERLLVNG